MGDAIPFYRIPKKFFEDQRYKSLSTDAMLLYGVLLDRSNLSESQGWKTEDGQTYIIFTVDSIMKIMNCHSQKATKLLEELESLNLIKKKRQGQGKPNIITVSDLFSNSKIEVQEFRKSKSKDFENQNSKVSKIEVQEFRKSKCNKTDSNKTDISNINPIIPKGMTAKSKQEELFEKFWKVYPRKVAKEKAFTSFRRLKPDEALTDRMIAAVEKSKQSCQWQENGGRFIPHPTTWLNQRRWEDEEPEVPKQTGISGMSDSSYSLDDLDGIINNF